MVAKIKVFLVDDHPVFRHGLREIIHADPRYEVVGDCGDGDEALVAIPRSNPQVVILDLTLPRRSGLEVMRSIRASQCPAACLMLTMHAEQSTFDAAMDAGAQGYLLKDDAMELVLLGLKVGCVRGGIPESSHIRLARATAATLLGVKGGEDGFGCTDGYRATRSFAGGGEPDQPGNRGQAFHQPSDRRDPSREHLPKARAARRTQTASIRHRTPLGVVKGWRTGRIPGRKPLVPALRAPT